MRFTCHTEKKKKNLLHVFFLFMHVYTYISECPPPPPDSNSEPYQLWPCHFPQWQKLNRYIYSLRNYHNYIVETSESYIHWPVLIGCFPMPASLDEVRFLQVAGNVCYDLVIPRLVGLLVAPQAPVTDMQC